MLKSTAIEVLGLITVLMLLFCSPSSADTNDLSGDKSMEVMRGISSMPLAFTQNNGQWPDSILFRANAGGATMWFTRNGAYYQFTRNIPVNQNSEDTDIPEVDIMPTEPRGLGIGSDSVEIQMIKASFVGADPYLNVAGRDKMGYKCNYFLGNDSTEWRTDVPNYGSVVFEEIYAGIDLKYYGNGRQMEYDFIVSPGADYAQINIQYEGAKSLSVNEFGELAVGTAWGKVIEHRPKVYQERDGELVSISGEYVLVSENIFGFKLGVEYAPQYAVIIDPLLTYSTYLGGSGGDRGYDIDVDDSGYIYVTGFTQSSNFPDKNAYQVSYNGGESDVYVTKLSVAGDSLIYSTFLGGSSNDWDGKLRVDRFHCVYICGYTFSSNFPTMNPYDATISGWDGFVSKLSASGNALIYSTFLGGTNSDVIWDLAVDSALCAYAAGQTYSYNFPTQNPYDGSYNGAWDAFITKFSAAGNSLIYSTYLGGSDTDVVWDIAVDDSGYAYIASGTNSTNFPVQNPYDASFNGGESDAIVAKLSPSGNTLIYSTYLGGSGREEGQGIDFDSSGCAYVTGLTWSSDFPTQNAYDNSYSNGDAFVTKLSSSGSSLVYSTYIGGTYDDHAFDILVDDSGCAYVCGGTWSSDFPTYNGFNMSSNGAYEGFITKLSTSGNSLIYSTYLGGSGNEIALKFDLDPKGVLCVIGWTTSTDFPFRNGYDSTYNGDPYDIFIAKIDPIGVTVAKANDAGLGSLRWAIDSANNHVGPDTIVFAASGTLGLLNPLPALHDDSTIILGSTAPNGIHSFTLGNSQILTGNGLKVLSSYNRIEGLTITDFPGSGIVVSGASSVGNTITNNLIYGNGGLAIDLNNDGVTNNDPGDGDTGPNDLLNYPEIDSAFMSEIDSSFTVYGRAADSSTIELFISHPAKDTTRPADPSGHGEAYSYIGSDTCDNTGKFTYIIPKSAGQFSMATATATDKLGNTSEFSENLTLTPGPLIIGAYSPVNLRVTDPEGYYIGKDASGNLQQTLFPATYTEIIHDSVNIPHPKLGNYLIEVIGEIGAPPGATYSIGILIDGSVEATMMTKKTAPTAGMVDSIIYAVEEGWHFLNGDANRSENINILDASYLINYLYRVGPPPDPKTAGDADCNGRINILDVSYLINYLYKGGPKPCEIE